MANGLNKVQLIGNIGQDPELRHTQSGTAVLNLRLATSERRKVREEWEEHTEWHDVVIWDKRAEALSKILEKGGSVYIEGRLRTNSYEDREGNKRYRTEIHASEIIITGGGGRRDERRDDRRGRDSDRGRDRRRDDDRYNNRRDDDRRGGGRRDFA